MDLITKLREETNSEHVAYTEFILKLKRNKDCLFCFFEGKDDYKYYGIRISNICQKNFQSIHCGGKDNVIALKKLIESKREYKNVLISYFIDRDYDDHIKIDNLYCLPSYSIENQYSTKQALIQILINEFSLKEEHEDFKKVISIFTKLQDDFHEKVTMINAWLACQNDKRKNQGIRTHLKIDHTIGHYFNSIVNEELGEIKNLGDLNNIETIESLFPDAPQIKRKELETKINFLKRTEVKYTFRGKFELLFFISFLKRLKSEICKKEPVVFSKRHKCTLSLLNS